MRSVNVDGNNDVSSVDRRKAYAINLSKFVIIWKTGNKSNHFHANLMPKCRADVCVCVLQMDLLRYNHSDGVCGVVALFVKCQSIMFMMKR